MARMIVEEGGQVIDLPNGQNTIGRLPENTIQLAGGTVSGKHAMITVDGASAFIEDIGSRNGTFVNQQQVTARTPLNHSDAVHFGQTAVRFENPAAAPAPQANLAGQASETGLLGDGPTSRSHLGEATVAVSDDEGAEPTITGTISGAGRFGLLEVNPQAKLQAVLDISSSLAGTVDLESLLPKILDTLFGIFKYADRGCILLKDDATGTMVPRGFKHRQQGADASVRLSRTIVNKVLSEKTAVLSADAATDSQFDASESISELKIHSMMCAPMLGLDGEPTGIISIDSQNPLGQFQSEDLEILMTVAGQAALSYENARLMQSFMEKQKQDNEMEIAKGVQRALLPVELPPAEGYEFFASYDSAQAVGGDYYDAFNLGNGIIALSFGDVAGKGVPGALIMSRISSCVQSTLQHLQDVEEAMCAINDHMCDSAVEGRFVTYVLCFVDTVNHTVTMSNAGHMSPVIRHADGSIELFDDDLVGPPIGVVDEYPFQAETKPLNPGDLVVIVTDGVDEAMNFDNELYGTERMIEFVKNGTPKADELGKALLADVRQHANGRPQNDDITIMSFGRNG